MRHDGSSVPRGDMESTITLLGSAEWKEHQAAKERQHNAIGGNSVESSGGSATDDGTKPAVGTPLDELLVAAQAGEADGVAKALAKLEARSDVTWIAGRAASLANAFSAACRNGHVGIAETLLKSGASVEAVDGEGATPLLAAADSGFASCVQLLLEAGAHPDARDKVGVTPLIAAAYNGHKEALSALVRHGAAVDARSHGGVTPLIAAAEGRHACCIRLLVQAGADVNARTSEGKTALMHAVGRNSLPATEALLAGGADVSAVDGEGLSALHHGARLDAADCVELLCAKGASMTKRCKKGRTALMDAPKGSASAAILEEKWTALEEEVARRQLELLELFADDASDAASSKANTPAAAGAKSGKDKKKAGKGRSRTPKGIASLTSKLQGLAEGPGSAAGSAAGPVDSAGLVGDVQNLVVKTPESSSRPSMSPVSSVMDFGQTTDSSGMSTAEDEEGEGEGEDEESEYDTEDIFEIMAAASKKGSGGSGGRVSGGVGSGAGVADGNDGNPASSTGSPTPSAVQSGSNGCPCKQSQQHVVGNSSELARRVAELEAELRSARAAADAARAAAAAERARAAQLEQQLISGRKAAEIISARDKSQIQVLQQSLCSQSISLAAATASAEASRRALASSHSDWHSQLQRIRCQAVAAAITAATASWQAWENSQFRPNLGVAASGVGVATKTAATAAAAAAAAAVAAAAGAAATAKVAATAGGDKAGTVSNISNSSYIPSPSSPSYEASLTTGHASHFEAAATAVNAAPASPSPYGILEVALLCQQLSDSTAASRANPAAAEAAAAAAAAEPMPRHSSHATPGVQYKPSTTTERTAATAADPVSHDPMLSFKASLLAGKTGRAANGAGIAVSRTARAGAAKLGDADAYPAYPADEDVSYPADALKSAVSSGKLGLDSISHDDAAVSLKASFISGKLLSNCTLDRSSSMEFLQGMKPGMKAGTLEPLFSSPHHHHDTTASIMRKIGLSGQGEGKLLGRARRGAGGADAIPERTSVLAFEKLPFAPKSTGEAQKKATGWFSLVPSPDVE
ncbi:unnamed protein product [Closterium sp. NIES-65]|nr:unnamed protein product [Closterium sp. NIES-65]